MYVMDWFYSNVFKLRTLGLYDKCFQGLFSILSISQLLDLDIDETLSHWTWCPSASTCIKLLQMPHRTSTLSSSGWFLGLSPMSHVLFTARTSVTWVPTNYLNGILALTVARLDAAQQSLFSTRFLCTLGLRAVKDGLSRNSYTSRLMSASAPPLTCVSANNLNAAILTILVCRNARPLNGRVTFAKWLNISFHFIGNELPPREFVAINDAMLVNEEVFWATAICKMGEIFMCESVFVQVSNRTIAPPFSLVNHSSLCYKYKRGLTSVPTSCHASCGIS